MKKNNFSVESRILIGWASEDITPEGTVSLFGQYYERKSTFVESRLTATACAIESWPGNEGLIDQAIMVSLDLIWITKAINDEVKEIIRQDNHGIDASKIYICATHTHSGPDPDLASYAPFLVQKLVKLIREAWNKRVPATISSALDYTVTGHNRRVCYANGTTEMYGSVDRPDFIGLEGPTDAGVPMIYCWKGEALTGIIMSVPCPAQVTEAKYYVSADYWAQVRKGLKFKYGRDIFVLAQCSAAGDLSPRDLPRGYQHEGPNMWDIAGAAEIGSRLVSLIEKNYNKAKQEMKAWVPFGHIVKEIELPKRIISESELEKALKISNEIHRREPADPNDPGTAWNRFLLELHENELKQNHGPWDNKDSDYGWMRPMDITIEQYREHKEKPSYSMELHVLRIGNVAIATNSFELYLDYGLQIMGRSKAPITMLAQLTSDYAGYLPTERALAGGGYSAMANPVGAPGGRLLVETTISIINEIWEKQDEKLSLKQAL